MAGLLEAHDFDSSPIFHDSGYQHSGGVGAGPAVHGAAPSASYDGGGDQPSHVTSSLPGEGRIGVVDDGSSVKPKPTHQKGSGYMPYGDTEVPSPQDEASKAAARRITERSTEWTANMDATARNGGNAVEYARDMNEAHYEGAGNGKFQDTDAVIAKASGAPEGTEYAETAPNNDVDTKGAGPRYPSIAAIPGTGTNNMAPDRRKP